MSCLPSGFQTRAYFWLVVIVACLPSCSCHAQEPGAGALPPIADFAREPASAPHTPFQERWSHPTLKGVLFSPDWKWAAQTRGAGATLLRRGDLRFARYLTGVFPATRTFDLPPQTAASAWSGDSREYVAWGHFRASGTWRNGKKPSAYSIWIAQWNAGTGQLRWRLETSVRVTNYATPSGAMRLDKDGTVKVRIQTSSAVEWWRVRAGKIVEQRVFSIKDEPHLSPTGRFSVTQQTGHPLRLHAAGQASSGVSLPAYSIYALKVWGPNDEVVGVQSYPSGLYRTSDGKLLWTFQTPEYGPNPFLGFSRDGKWIVTRETVGKSTQYLLRATLTGKILRRYNWQSDPYDAALGFSPDNQTFALFYRGLNFFEMPSGRLQRRIEGFDYGPEAVTFTPDGNTLATGDGGSGNVVLWDWRAGTVITRLDRPNNGLEALAFTPDGGRLATGNNGSCGEDTVRVWNVATRQQLWEMQSGYNTNGVAALRWSPDGVLLAVAGGYGPAQILDGRDGKRIAVLGGHAARYAVAYDAPASKRTDPTLFWSSDARELWVGGSAGITVWDRNGHLLRRLESIQNIYSMARCPSGQRVAVGTTEGEILLLQVGEEKVSWRQALAPTYSGAKAAIRVAFLPSDRVLSCGDGPLESGTVRVWDVQGGFVSQTLQSTWGTQNLATSRDGTLVAAVGGGAQVWQTAPDQVVPAPISGSLSRRSN